MRKDKRSIIPGETGRATHLLLQVENRHLELALNLRVLDLDPLESVDPTLHRGR